MENKYSGEFKKYEYSTKTIIDILLLNPVLNFYNISIDQWAACLNSNKLFIYSSNENASLFERDESFSYLDINHLSTKEKEDLKDLFKSENNE